MLLLLEVLAIYLVKSDSRVFQEIVPSIRAMIPADMFSQSKSVANDCDAALPANGSIHTFNPYPAGPAGAKLEITNQHAYPVVLQINSVDQSVQYQAISVHPNGTAPVTTIPAGSYGMTILAGSTWCNMEKGFSDGEKIPAKKQLEIKPDANQTLVFTSRGSGPKDFYLVSTMAPIAGAGQQIPTTENPVANGVQQETEQQKRDRCYAAYTKVRDEIQAQMRQQHTVQHARQFAEQLRKNEQAYVECRR
jgi:hypothetical protein